MNKVIFKLLAVVLALVSQADANAKCGPGGIQVVSGNTILAAGDIIVLEFYGASESFIPGLNKKYPVYLRAGAVKVFLEVAEVLKGEFRVSQVVLKPSSPLQAGEKYQLEIDKLPKNQWDMKRYDTLLQRWEPVLFSATVSGSSTPVFSSVPVEVKKTMVAYGCGPARWVYFKMDGLRGQAGALVRATVRNRVTGKTTAYYLPVENGMVRIGHGMCSGGFYLQGAGFAVSFSLAGNAGEAAKEIAFEAPTVFSQAE